MKKPYIKRFCKISVFNVFIVDGNYIRKNINEEFTNFGQSYRFNFIPKNEFWIDKESTPGEEKYFIDHLLVEHRLMKEGMSYKKAIEKADLVEKRERNKYEHLNNIKKRNIIKNIHKKKLKQYSKNVSVWIINGKLVRDLYCIDFTEGGHDKVYHFIPEKEIWIDDDISPKERKFILIHELHERYLMSKGLNYDKAHRSSSNLEYFCRHHPSKLSKRLRIELNKNQ